MRALPLSVAVSSLVLGGWLTGARAQNVGVGLLPPAQNAALDGQTGETQQQPLLPGVIPQPTVEDPGMVAGITLGELYTDNLKLAGGGKSKQSSFITQVQPFFKAARNSPRLSGVVDATLSGYLYPQHMSYNQLAPDLDAQGTLTLLPQHFFLDGFASYRRQIINNQAPAGSASYFLDNNQANIATASLSPWWMQDLGSVGIMTARYTHGRVVYNRRGISGEGPGLLGGVPNVTMDAGQFSLVSPQYQTWGWNLSYSEQRMQPDFGASIDFAIAKVGTSLKVGNDLRLLADGGKENKFNPDGTVQKLEAPFWDAGFEWSNGRDNFSLLVGHRFFGRSYQLSWTHHAALLTTNVSYVEQPTNYNQQFLGMNPGTVGIPTIGMGSDVTALTERLPYLSKRLSASAIYTMPHGMLTVRAYDERRTFFTLDNEREHVVNAQVSWLFELGAYTTLTPMFNWQRYRFRDGQTNDTRYAQLELVHQYDPKNFGSVSVRHDTRGVESMAVPGAHGYTANVLFVQWTHLY